MRPHGQSDIDHPAAVAVVGVEVEGAIAADMAVGVLQSYYWHSRCWLTSTDRGGGTVMATADAGSRWAVCRRVLQYS